MNVSNAGKVLVLAVVLTALIPDVVKAHWEKDDDVNAYRLQLKERIELGEQWGKLSAADTAQLQEDLRKINKLERRSSRSGLKESEKQSLWSQLEQIDTSVTKELKDREKIGWHQGWDRNRDGLAFWKAHYKVYDYDAFKSNLRAVETKVATGIASGKITPDESGYLNGESARLRGLLDQAKQAGGMSADEITSFERMTAKLDERLERTLQSAPTSKWNSGNFHHGWKNSKNPTVKNLTTPPKWLANKDGGYYDATEQIKGTVPGNELYRYGGIMKDGRAAPTTPHVHLNTSGHIVW